MNDDFMDDGDYDDEYGTSQEAHYYEGHGANAAMIEGSGGSEEYDDEEDISDESGMLRERHYIAQQLAAAKAAQQRQAAGVFGGGKPTGFGAAGAGAGASGLFAAASKPGGGLGGAGGGFAYGAASAGGSLFGAASAAQGGNTFASGLGQVGKMGGMAGGGLGLGAGASGAGAPKPGGFVFGQASQFGGAGSLFGPAPGAGAGAAASDDPYNIPIDLTKIKRTEKPAKTYEEKTSEEKQKAAMLTAMDSKAVGAKSIMKKPGQPKKEKKLSFGQCLVHEYDRDSESTAVAKRVDSRDISDMRDEKTKLRDMLQQKENEELAQIKKVQALMKATAGDAPSSKPSKIEDSLGAESGSQTAKSKVTESYTSDTFEDPSQSLSSSANKKGGIQYWPGKDAVAVDGSMSESQSKDKSEGGVLSANAMEEYLKKQQEKAAGQKTSSAPPAKKPERTVKDISESSDKYTDEDFDSISKSQSHSLPPAPALAAASGQAKQQTYGVSHIATTYVKKENKFTMTDGGKYDYMSKAPATSSEWSLKRNLEDAELLIQEQKHAQADLKDQLKHVEEKLKYSEMDFKNARREQLNLQETNNRMKEQLKEYQHKINLYKIETEELIKQIDMADAKTREKEAELTLMEAEYDRKLKMQEERILMRRSKNEQRETYDMRREHSIQMDELNQKMMQIQEELDYFKTKTEKLETEN